MPNDISTVFPLKAHRTHEVCGPGCYSFAFLLGAQVGGPFMWVQEHWRVEQINPAGFVQFLKPDDLLLASVQDQTELLAVAEEALRSAAVPLVVMELNRPLNLTAGRRLQLAAAAGNSTGLCIIPEGMGSNAAETRWHCTPIFDPDDSTLQSWRLIKNKSGTLGDWHVRWDAETRRIIVVSEAGKRSGSQDATD